ncbi:phosphoglycolate phosphatase [Sandarakinorhabdus sp.]|uniref:phosphoglycolate phosphatase n=1 Tax=Sandarakinorhabdus sp. TaxID=1916663 RepID=UPI003F713797
MILPRTILFDLDGTLVDTAPDLAAAMNHVLSSLGRPPLPIDDVRHLVGHGARALISRGLAATGPAPPELVESGVPLFLEYYAAHIADASRPFDGVEAALDALAAAGCRLAICTNKPVALATALIDALGWRARFAAIVGFDSVPKPKPDAGHVHATLAACGGDVASAVFVGDSATDVGAARNAGLPIILVSFGFSDTPARDLGADAVIDHYDALLPVLAGMAELAA